MGILGVLLRGRRGAYLTLSTICRLETPAVRGAVSVVAAPLNKPEGLPPSRLNSRNNVSFNPLVRWSHKVGSGPVPEHLFGGLWRRGVTVPNDIRYRPSMAVSTLVFPSFLRKLVCQAQTG